MSIKYTYICKSWKCRILLYTNRMFLGSFFVKSATHGSDHLRFSPNFAKTLALPKNLKLSRNQFLCRPPWGWGCLGSLFVKSATHGSDHIRFSSTFAKTLALHKNSKLLRKKCSPPIPLEVGGVESFLNGRKWQKLRLLKLP